MPKQTFMPWGKNKKDKFVYALICMDDIAEVNLEGEVYMARDKPGILIKLVKPEMTDKDGNVYGVSGADDENKKRKTYASMLLSKIKKEPEKTYYTTKDYVFFDSFKEEMMTVPTVAETNVVVEHRRDIDTMTDSDKIKEIRELQQRLNELKRKCKTYEIDAMEMLDNRGYDCEDDENVVGYEGAFLRGLNLLISNTTSDGEDDTFCDAIWKSYKLWVNGKGPFDMEFKRVSKMLKKINNYVKDSPERFKIKNLKNYLKYVARKVYETEIGDEYLGQDAPVERYAPPEAVYEMIDAYDW